MSVVDKITPETLFSYARACIEVARTCGRLGAEGYSHTVVPSRGAAPVESGAVSYFYSVVRHAVRGNDRWAMMKDHIAGPLGSTIYLPFTADSCEEMEGIDSGSVRRFWTKVLAAIVRGDRADPHYRFSRHVRDGICRVGFEGGLEDKLRSGRFVFLDTVVSGRAITEIIDAFDAEGLTECHYILILDEDGARLKGAHRQRLEALAAIGRATLLPMASLFTEDQGPSVSGIWCLTCPELMTVAREEIPAFAEHGAIGAGVYYHEVRQREDGSNRAMTLGIAGIERLLHEAVQIVASPEQLMDDLSVAGLLTEDFNIDWQLQRPAVMGRWYDEQVEEYLEHLRRERLFDQATTLAVAAPKLKAAAVVSPRVEVSSSHALRLHFSKDEAARLVRAFNEELASPPR